MPIVDKNDDKVIKLVTETALKYKAKVKKIDLARQILDVDCPEENKDECAVAIQKILVQHFGESSDE
jgi:c-di-GMP-binding flagellar brake protein YcgR